MRKGDKAKETIKKYNEKIKELERNIDTCDDLQKKRRLNQELSKVILDRTFYLFAPDNFDYTNDVEKTKLAESYTIMLSKIGNMPFRQKNSLDSNIMYGVAMGKNKTNVFLSLNYSKIQGLENRLNLFDKAVYNAVCSIWEKGRTTCTYHEIYAVLCGNASKELSPQIKKKLEQSIVKMRVTLLTLDYTNYLQEYIETFLKYDKDYQKFKNINSIKKNVNLLYSTTISVNNRNGTKVEAIRLLAQPPLLEYSKCFKQLTTISSDVLNIPNFRCQVNYITYRDYLLTFISHIKGTKTWNKTLKFTTIYQDLEITEDSTTSTNRTLQQRCRAVLYQCLDYWKSIGFIKDYSVKKVKNKHYSLTIDVDKKNKGETLLDQN